MPTLQAAVQALQLPRWQDWQGGDRGGPDFLLTGSANTDLPCQGKAAPLAHREPLVTSAHVYAPNTA